MCGYLFLFFSVFTLNNWAKTEQEHVYLWKISHTKLEKTSYLLGTMHIPWRILYEKFSTSIKNAIKLTDVVVTEINTDKSQWRKLEKSIKERKRAELSENIRERVKKVNKSFLKLPSDWLYLSLGPILFEHRLEEAAFLKNKFSAEFDEKIKQIGNNKQNKYLENYEDISIFLPNVDEKSMELIIEHTLDVAEDEKRNGKNKLKTIVEWFKNGTWTLEKEEDYDYGLAYSQDKQKTLKQASEKLNNDAIYARSKKWAIKMDKWMKEESPADGQKSFLFAVGLSHIISEKNNLRQLLTTKGYTVEEIPKFDKVGTSSAHGTDVEEEEEEVIEQLEDKKEKQNEKSQLND